MMLSPFCNNATRDSAEPCLPSLLPLKPKTTAKALKIINTRIVTMDVVLKAPPGDGISSVCFSPTAATSLLVGSWDTTVRLYDVEANANKLTSTLGGACLACCFKSPGGDKCYAGGLDQAVYTLDLWRGGPKTILGGHDNAVSCMQYNAASGSLFTGSWDCSVRGWDERTAGSVSKLEKMDEGGGGKVFSLSTEGTLLVAVTSSKQIFIYDTRALHEPLQVKESPLRHQLRRVALSLDSTYYVLGSTEARVAVEFVGQEENTQKKNYTFKCHRKDGVAHPINAIAFHPIHGTFVTGGCDGVVNAWDGLRKKRISQLPSYPTSIASLAFNKDGSLLAVAASYTFEEGQQAAPTADDVYIRRLDASEVSPPV